MPKKTTKKDEPTNEVPSAPAVFDVSKPGETAAHPTSKPVIVGHTSSLKQDPMVAPSSEVNELEPESEVKDLEAKEPKGETVIEPLSDKDTAEEPKETEKSESPEASEEPANEEDNTKTEESDSPNTAPESSETGEIEALATEAGSKKQTKQELEAIEKEQQKNKELIDSKKYNLPIREGGRKRSSEIMLLWSMLVLILVIAAAWYVVDAGYYDPGFELPYDFIDN